MGNAGIDCGNCIVPHSLLQHLSRAAGGYGRPVESGLAHVHLGPERALSFPDLHRDYASKRLHIELLAHISPVPGILGQAADAIAAHLRLRSVRLDEPHAQFSPGAAGEEQDPIRAYAAVAVAACYSKPLLVFFSHLGPGHLIY